MRAMRGYVTFERKADLRVNTGFTATSIADPLAQGPSQLPIASPLLPLTDLASPPPFPLDQTPGVAGGNAQLASPYNMLSPSATPVNTNSYGTRGLTTPMPSGVFSPNVPR